MDDPRLRAISFGIAAAAAISCAVTQVAAQGSEAPRSDGEREARALFDAGQVAFSEGRYDRAYEHFRETYALSPRPELLYNVALAADRARLDDEAIARYEQFVAERPDHPRAELARTRIEALRRFQADRTSERVDTDASALPDAHPGVAAVASDPSADAPPLVTPSVEPVATRADTAPASGEDPGPAPWIVLTAGGALAVAGGIVLGVGVADAASVANAPDGSSWAGYRDAYDRAEALEIAGAVSLGVGVTLVAIGLGWGVAAGGGGERAAVSVEPTGNGMRVRF